MVRKLYKVFENRPRLLDFGRPVSFQKSRTLRGCLNIY